MCRNFTTKMKELLKKLGAKNKEIILFMTLLERGSQPVSTLAKRLSLPRSSTYVLLDRLKKLGLVEEFEKSGVKYMHCVPVEKIQDLIDFESRRIHELQSLYAKNVEAMKALENRSTVTPSVRHFEGKIAVMKM